MVKRRAGFIILLFYIFSFKVLFPESSFLVSAYRTTLLGLEAGSRYNLFIAAQKLNGYRLSPGERFSFLKFFSPLNSNNGYVLGGSLRGQNYVYLPAGGLCQMASTLYAAALYGGLEILERHPHTVRVHHIFPGLDATLSEVGRKDLCFKNTYGDDLQIKSYIERGFLYVEFWSKIEAKPEIVINRKEKYYQDSLKVHTSRVINGIIDYETEDFYPVEAE